MTIYNAPLHQIDVKEVRRYAGLGNVDFNAHDILHACQEVQIVSQCKGSWKVYDYCASTATIQSIPKHKIIGDGIRQHLESASKVVILSLTIGEAIEYTIHNSFKEGTYAYALLLDAAATTAVETAADEMEKTISAALQKKGYQLLTRFSPGYGDWDIRFQPQMLSLSEAEKIGLSLTESYMLKPRKSITAIIGLTAAQCTIVKERSCETCTKKNCFARKEQNDDPNF